MGDSPAHCSRANTFQIVRRTPSTKRSRIHDYGSVAPSSEIGLIYLLYVLPEYWGRGVGTALMRAAIDELRDLGMRDAALWVLRDNQPARRFYESLGWHRDGRASSQNYGGVELEAWCYRRAITVACL
jgi:GNAT superfamily N-acetyltransferase